LGHGDIDTITVTAQRLFEATGIANSAISRAQSLHAEFHQGPTERDIAANR
jgi:hypothetical protein